MEKAYLRGSRKVESIASDLNISPNTMRTWMRRDKKRSEKRYSVDSKRPKDRSRAERLELLMESHGLDEEGLSAFCRKRGIFVHHLREWREEFETGTVTKDDAALVDARSAGSDPFPEGPTLAASLSMKMGELAARRCARPSSRACRASPRR